MDTSTDSFEVIRFADIRNARIAKDRKTIYAWMTLSIDPFPAAIRLGNQGIAWRRCEVASWLEGRRLKASLSK